MFHLWLWVLDSLTFSQLFLHKEEYESDKSVHAEGQEIHWYFHNDSNMTVELFTL